VDVEGVPLFVAPYRQPLQFLPLGKALATFSNCAEPMWHPFLGLRQDIHVLELRGGVLGTRCLGCGELLYIKMDDENYLALVDYVITEADEIV
jgi:hypothetical protein